ncbi:unnamed protein product, partial [Effrenium voratum]
DFLRDVASELSRVPIVLALHARKDSMSSFRDVKCVINQAKECADHNGTGSVVKLFQVPDEQADSDKNRKKKRISGHHYFNFALLDDTSEDFFWAKLRSFLDSTPKRLEVQPLQRPTDLPQHKSNGFTGRYKCPRCGGPKYMGPDEHCARVDSRGVLYELGEPWGIPRKEQCILSSRPYAYAMGAFQCSKEGKALDCPSLGQIQTSWDVDGPAMGETWSSGLLQGNLLGGPVFYQPCFQHGCHSASGARSGAPSSCQTAMTDEKTRAVQNVPDSFQSILGF